MDFASPLAADAGTRSPKHLWDYWRILWEGRRLLAIALAVTTVVAVIGTLMLPNRYRAECFLRLNLAPAVVLGTDAERASRLSFFEQDHEFKTEFIRIKTRAMVSKAVEKHELLSALPGLEKAKDPILVLLKSIDVDRIPQTNVAVLTVSWGNPEQAATIANAVAHTYVDSDLEERIGDLERRAGKLGESAKESSQSRVQALAHDLKILYGDPDIETVMSLGSVEKNENFKSLRQGLEKVDGELSSLRSSYGDGYQEVKAKVAEKQALLDKVAEERRAVRVALEEEYRALGFDPSSLQAGPEVAFVGEGEMASNKSTEELLRKRVAEARVQAQLAEPKAEIIEKALPPVKPYAPKLALNLALAIVVGLGFGGGLVFFRDYLDSAVKTLDDIEKHLGLATLAVVPRFQGEPPPVAREAFQTLRTGLLFASSGRRDRIVLVTSSAPQEGKTSVATGLARCIAGSGESVVVVDCDLRRPSVGRALGVKSARGLSNYLADASERDWKPYVTPVDGKLSALLTGPVPPNPLSLLGQVRLAELFRELKGAYDWVIVDSPPVSSVSDSLILASLCELVILTIRHDATDKEVARRTLHRLRGVNGQVMGAVLTDVDMEKPYNRDYYYGRFYYGHYYGSDGAGEAPPATGWRGTLAGAGKKILKG